jgi:RimJ/RimL family protein N-acetyltransferase
VSLRPLDPDRDAGVLFELSHAPSGEEAIWTYLPYGPFPTFEAFAAHLREQAATEDPLFFTVLDHDRGPQGIASYLAVVPEHGRIELGHIWLGPKLQRSAAATEAIYLLIANAFDSLGHRRVEWKCNALNAPSRNAAERFGFEYEGTFFQHQVVKGRNRDTAWFSITDQRWPVLKPAFERWLDPANFDSDGRQLSRLGDLRGS